MERGCDERHKRLYMTQHLEYSEIVDTTPEDVWTEWFEAEHSSTDEDDDLPSFDKMDDDDE